VNWPKVTGSVWSTSVGSRPVSENSRRGYDAYVTYSFSLVVSGQLDYFTGDFGRFFEDTERAKAWLKSLEDKQIPVRVKPGKPSVSAVLDCDLDSL